MFEFMKKKTNDENWFRSAVE